MFYLADKDRVVMLPVLVFWEALSELVEKGQIGKVSNDKNGIVSREALAKK